MTAETLQMNSETDVSVKGSSAKTSGKKPETYKVGIGRQLVLWITFMIFLPFFISMPVMIFMRIVHGKIMDTLSLGLIFLFALVGIIFIILQILAAGRQRIEIHDDKVSLKLPTWRGPTPVGPVIKTVLPYSEISAIEKRGELYTLMGLLGLREVSCIVTTKGDRYILGYMAESEADAPIPYDMITTTLSEKAGKSVEHKGAVNGGTQMGALFRGAPSWDTPPLNSDDVNRIRKRAERLTLLVILAFLAVVLAGLGLALYPEIVALFNAPAPQ